MALLDIPLYIGCDLQVMLMIFRQWTGVVSMLTVMSVFRLTQTVSGAPMNQYVCVPQEYVVQYVCCSRAYQCVYVSLQFTLHVNHIAWYICESVRGCVCVVFHC